MNAVAAPSLPIREITLWSGDLAVATEPCRMTTVLGSCVAVCLFDPVRQYGGMNHYLLPDGEPTARCGRWATRRLAERLETLGSRRGDLQAKLFGGATPMSMSAGPVGVGDANISVARQVLQELNIPIVAERVGCGPGMRIIFESWTGVVWFRRHAP